MSDESVIEETKARVSVCPCCSHYYGHEIQDCSLKREKENRLAVNVPKDGGSEDYTVIKDTSISNGRSNGSRSLKS